MQRILTALTLVNSYLDPAKLVKVKLDKANLMDYSFCKFKHGECLIIKD